MILGRVVGEVWATKKHPALEGRKLLVVEPYLWYAPSHEVAHLVAVDAVGAGVGEVVLYASGSSARQTKVTKDRPVDATIMAIVDEIEIEGDPRYQKVPTR